jgi:hypothetical protein
LGGHQQIATAPVHQLETYEPAVFGGGKSLAPPSKQHRTKKQGAVLDGPAPHDIVRVGLNYQFR